jgi:heptosyltransferase-2
MKILLIAMAGIGDTLLATPLIRELRLNYPDAQIDALVLWKGAKAILETCPHLNTVYQKNLLAERRADSLRFLRSVGANRYDVSINAHPQSRIHYRIIARVVGARERLSHRYECWTPCDRFLVNRVIEQDYSRHTVEHNLDFLNVLGKKPLSAEHRLEVCLTATDQAWAETFVNEHSLSDRTILGVHPGSGGTKNLALKRWPEDHYRELLRRLKQEIPRLAVVLFGGPEEWDGLERLRAEVQMEAMAVARAENLRQTAALIARCDSFLSVDTALMHVAAAVQARRQIVIEAPTFNKTNEPYHHPFTLVRNPAVGGRNLDFYRYDGRGIKGTEEELRRCMASVTVDAVTRVVLEQLAEQASVRG